MADNESHPHGGPSRVALMRRNGELRAELEAAEAEVRALREQVEGADQVKRHLLNRAEAAEAEVRALRERLAAYKEFVEAHLAVEALIADHTDDRDAYNAAVERADRALAVVAATADPAPHPETRRTDPHEGMTP